MNKLFGVITVEIVLLAIVGILSSLIANTISLDVSSIWIILFLAMLILIPTSWLKLMYEKDDKSAFFNVKIPDQINLSISLEPLKKNPGIIFTLILNGVIFGGLAAYVSVLMSGDNGVYGFVAQHELIGGLFICLASLVVMRRLSFVFGLLFCSSSSIVFSITHLALVPWQSYSFTIFANLLSFILITVILQVMYPLLAKFIIDFWRSLFNASS